MNIKTIFMFEPFPFKRDLCKEFSSEKAAEKYAAETGSNGIISRLKYIGDKLFSDVFIKTV